MPLVRVTFYARARDLAGTPSIQIALDAPATIADLHTRIFSDYPSLLPLKKSLLTAKNARYVSPSDELKDGDVVDIMPPVSGG